MTTITAKEIPHYYNDSLKAWIISDECCELGEIGEDLIEGKLYYEALHFESDMSWDCIDTFKDAIDLIVNY